MRESTSGPSVPGSPTSLRGETSRSTGQQIRLQFREHLDLYRNADLLVGISLFYAGRSIAEHFGLPYRHVFFTPQVFRSPSTTPPSARRMSRSRLVNSLLWQRHLAQEDFVVGRIVNDERSRLGLTPLRHAADGRTGPGTVLAVDPVFARLPADLAQRGTGIRQAHYWYHEGDDPAPDPETVRFLDEGEPPILVSLGSADLVMKDAATTYARLCGTLTGLGTGYCWSRRSPSRAILVARSTGPGFSRTRRSCRAAAPSSTMAASGRYSLRLARASASWSFPGCSTSSSGPHG